MAMVLLSAPGEAGEALRTPVRTGIDAAAEGLDDPGVHGDAVTGGGELDAALERLGQTQGDAGGEGVLGADGRARRRRLLDVRERRILAGEPNLDVAARQLRGQLVRHRSDRLEQAKAERRVERGADALDGLGRRGITQGGDGFEVALDGFDERADLHGGTMTSL